MSTQVQLYQTLQSYSEEWEMLEHYLMLCARTSRIRIISAWRMGLGASTAPAAFHQNSASRRLSLFCWVDMNSLGSVNDLQSVARRGIQISTKGMCFVHGNLILPGFPLLSSVHAPELQNFYSLGSRRTLQLLLCEVAVGNTFIVEDESQAVLDALPSGFDSFMTEKPVNDPAYASPEQLLNNKKGSWFKSSAEEAQTAARTSSFTFTFPSGGPPTHENAEVGVLPDFVFRQHYIVFHSSQVCPRYLVSCEVEPVAPEHFALPLCESCGTKAAAIWCEADTASLCQECDRSLHTSSELARRHVRIPLHTKTKPPGRCSNHPGEEVFAFCCECHVPVCHLCEPQHLHGTDSGGGVIDVSTKGFDTTNLFTSIQENKKDFMASRSCLISVETAYNALRWFNNPLTSSGSVHSLDKHHRNQLNSLIVSLKETRENVEGNARFVESQIHAAIANALRQLQSHIDRRVSLVAGRKLDLQIRIEELRWSQEFLRYLQVVLSPQDFLYSWLKHKRLQQRLEKGIQATEQGVASDIVENSGTSDLQVEGRLELKAV